MVGKSGKYCAANTLKIIKENQANSEQHIAYSISCSKAENEKKDLLQDGGKIKKGKNIDHQGPRTIPNICHLPDLPTFSLVPTFKYSNLAMCTVYKPYS